MRMPVTSSQHVVYTCKTELYLTSYKQTFNPTNSKELSEQKKIDVIDADTKTTFQDKTKRFEKSYKTNNL